MTINSSLTQSTVSTEWKTARVIPLLKKGITDDTNNYRPISILPTVSKLLQRGVHIQLCSHLHVPKIRSQYQFGFTERHWTEFATIAPTDTMRLNIDQEQLTWAVFVHLTKAFDTVNHQVLLEKMNLIGIMKKELEWFRDYLNNRTQFVQLQNTYFDLNYFKSGVPLFSILGRCCLSYLWMICQEWPSVPRS